MRNKDCEPKLKNQRNIRNKKNTQQTYKFKIKVLKSKTQDPNKKKSTRTQHLQNEIQQYDPTLETQNS